MFMLARCYDFLLFGRVACSKEDRTGAERGYGRREDWIMRKVFVRWWVYGKNVDACLYTALMASFHQ